MSLRFQPMDPDFPKKAFPGDNRLCIQFQLDGDYPATRPNFVVLLPIAGTKSVEAPWLEGAGSRDAANAEADADLRVVQKKCFQTAMRLFLESRPAGSLCVLPALRWLDKNIVAVLDTAAFVHQQQQQQNNKKQHQQQQQQQSRTEHQSTAAGVGRALSATAQEFVPGGGGGSGNGSHGGGGGGGGHATATVGQDLEVESMDDDAVDDDVDAAVALSLIHI